MTLPHHALLVGVGADLPDTVTDAQGLADLLADPTRCAFDPANVTTLTGPQATRTEILSALDRLAATTSGDGTVVIYFSGHGYLAEASIGRTYFLMPYGYDTAKLAATAISGSEFAAKLRAIGTARLLLLLDCCHAQGVGESKAAGLTLTKAPLPPEADELFRQGNGRILIASSKANELSFAGKPYSLFTRALIEGLSGAEISAGDGYVRALDLAMYASRKVSEWSKDRQHPTADTQRADNFVVAYYAAGAKTPLPLSLPPVDPAVVERENSTAIGYLQTGGVNLAGSHIDASGSQGANIGNTGPIHQTFERNRSIDTGGGAYIGGNVSVGSGDFVGRDKITYRNKTTGASVSDFTALLRQLQATVASAPLDDDERAAVEADLASVAAQVQKPEPKLSLITRGLNNIKAVLESAVGAGAAAGALAGSAQRGLELAQGLFK